MASVRVHRKAKDGTPILWKVTIKNKEGKWVDEYYKNHRDAKKASIEGGLAEFKDEDHRKGGNSLFLTTWNTFIERNSAKYRENTKQNYHRTKILLENDIIRMSDMTTRNVITCILKKQNHKYRTRITYISKLKRFIKWCKKNGYNNIEIDWDTIKDETLGRIIDDKVFLTIDEYRKIWCWFAEKGLHSRRTLIEILSQRGFRIKEILNSTIHDIDFNNKSITIRAEIEKTGNSRTVFLGDEILGSIKQQRDTYNKTNSDAIFICEKTGGPLGYKTMAKWWRICCKELNIKRKPIHRLRALAFYLIYKTSNHNIELAKQICGWQSSAYKYYVSSFKQELNQLDWAIRRFSTGWVEANGIGSIGEKIKNIIESDKGLEDKIAKKLEIEEFWMKNFMLFGWNNDLVRIENICKEIGYKLELIKLPDINKISTG